MQLQRHRADLLNQFAETSPAMHMLRTAISTFGHVANASRHTKAMLVAAVQIMVINKFCALLQSNTVTSYTGIRRQSILVNTAPTGLSQEFAQRDIAAPAHTAHCRFTLSMRQHKMLALIESITIVQQSFLNSLAIAPMRYILKLRNFFRCPNDVTNFFLMRTHHTFRLGSNQIKRLLTNNTSVQLSNTPQRRWQMINLQQEGTLVLFSTRFTIASSLKKGTDGRQKDTKGVVSNVDQHSDPDQARSEKEHEWRKCFGLHK